MHPTEPRLVDRGSPVSTVTTAPAPASARRDPPWEQEPLPLVLRVFLVVALSAALGYALVVTPLALVGHFAKGPVLLGAAVIGAFVAVVWLRALGPLPRPKFDAPVVVALAGILAMTALNFRYASQNVVQDRDPGAYLDTGRWFAGHHTFFLDGLTGAFTAHSQLRIAGAGFQAGAPGGRIYPQFLHLLPAFLAGAQWIGGESLLFRANALFAGLALLAFYAFARTWMRSALATVAVLMLAFNLVELLHSRNAYSEILSQVFLFGGLWALAEAERVGRRQLLFIAGLLLGVTCMVRIDGFVYLIPLTIVGTIRLWHAQSEGAPAVRRARETVVAVAAGLVVPCILGVLDGVRFSRPYLDDNKSFLVEVLAGLIVTVVGCAVALRMRRRRGQPFFSRRMMRWLGTGAAFAIVALTAYAWFIRPHVQTAYQLARPAGGIFDLRTDVLPAKIRVRTYSEFTVTRLNLFLGATTIIGAVLGAAYVARRIFTHPRDPRLPFLMIFGATTALYVWRPSIAPDMVWFLRRFLPVTIPGAALFTMVLAEELVRRRHRWTRAAAAILVIGGLAFPLYLLPHYVLRRTYVPLYDGVTAACNRAGNDAALLVVQSASVISGPQYRYPQALQAFCDVPVATAPPGLPADFYTTLANEWKRQGRQLVVIANLPQALDAVSGTAQVLEQTSYRVLQRTKRRRPTTFEQVALVLWFKRVPVTGAGT